MSHTLLTYRITLANGCVLTPCKPMHVMDLLCYLREHKVKNAKIETFCLLHGWQEIMDEGAWEGHCSECHPFVALPAEIVDKMNAIFNKVAADIPGAKLLGQLTK